MEEGMLPSSQVYLLSLLIGPCGRTEAQIGPLPTSPQLLISSHFPLHTSFRIVNVLLNSANVNLFAI